MSSLALARPDGTVEGTEALVKPIRDRLTQSREWRRQFEGIWQLSMAMAAGRHWQTYDRMTRTLRRMQDFDPRYADRELYSADMVTEYRTTMLGELGSDTDRPQLLLQRDDAVAEDYQEQANRAVTYGWDYEWDGDEILSQIDRLILDLGTAAVRVRFDATYGPTVADNVPYQNGQPVLDMAEATQLFEGGPNPDVEMGAIKQGRIRWDPLSVFNLLVPPGVPHERDFPWEAIDVPTPIEAVKETYGALAKDLEEDRDIGSVLGTDTHGSGQDAAATTSDGQKSRLRDHVRLITYFEKPTPRYPNGRVIVFAGKELTVLDYKESLEYVKPDGSYCSGLTYFHWWRVTGRFWSRSLVEAMMDGQRLLDKRRTQLNEIIDRSMPKVFVQRGSKAMSATGVPGEYIELEQGEQQPIPFLGVQPGAWMQSDVEAIREDIDHATGIKGPRLGENPAAITTYSQLALINESEAVKRSQIHRERKLGIKSLLEDSVYDIRAYWGTNRQIQLAGDENRIEAELFDATKIPAFFIIQVAPGAAKPESQAAKLKMIEDIANYSINSGQPLPPQWFKDSLEAGEPLDLPDQQSDDQTDKAEIENHMMAEGAQVPVAYYDRVDIHIPIHRSIQDQAMLAGDQETWQLVEEHVQLHLQAAQQNAAQLPPAPAPEPGEETPGGPPSGAPPPQQVPQ